LQVFQLVGCVKFGHTAQYRNLWQLCNHAI
jgi:hypothetical protein